MTQPHEQSDPKRDEQPKRDRRRPEDAPKTTQLRRGGEQSHCQPKVKRPPSRRCSRQLQETDQIENNTKAQAGKSVGQMEGENRAGCPEQNTKLCGTCHKVLYRPSHAADPSYLTHFLKSVKAPMHGKLKIEDSTSKSSIFPG